MKDIGFRLILWLLQTRLSDWWFRRISYSEREKLMFNFWGGLNKGLSQEQRYKLAYSIYDNRRLKNYSLAGSEYSARSYGFFKLIKDVELIEGDVVECGVGKGISLAMLVYAISYFQLIKTVYGFDSFSGFPAASVEDLGGRVIDIQNIAGWDATSPEMVYQIFHLDRQRPNSLLSRLDVPVKLVPGFFEDTIPDNLPAKIALLHIDCDLYESYKTVLVHCIPRMSSGGVIVFDEYEDQAWPGAKKAIDEICIPQNLKPVWMTDIQRFGIRVP